MWTHPATSAPYITVTAHYLNDAWELCGRVLATRPMKEKKTGTNTKTVVRGILGEFDADRDDNCFFTGNGSNMKAAVNDESWLSCAGHNINLTISHALDPKSVADDFPYLSVIDLINKCKDVVTRVKRTQIQSKLETTLKHVSFPCLSIFLNFICVI